MAKGNESGASLCPKQCPERTIHCHSTCQEYLKKKILNDLKNIKKQKEIEKLAFVASSREAVIKISRRAKKKHKGGKIWEE